MNKDALGVLRPPLAAERGRLKQVTWTFVLVAVGLGLRLAYIQTVRRDFYLQVAEEITSPEQPEAARPGRIYDAAGRALADAEAVAQVSLDPVAARESPRAGELRQYLVQNLGLPSERVEKALTASGRYVPLARHVPLATVQRLRVQRFPGIVIEPGFRRSYPYGKVAAHLLGGYSSDQRPLAGLDLRWRFVLAGEAGTPRRNVDAWGRTIVGMEADTALPPIPGKSVVTTVDLDLQRQVEAALDRLWSQNQPENACVVVMEPRTGAVLALSSRPTYDPNHLAPRLGEERGPVTVASMLNHAVNWEYEPGSTFKILTAACALQTGAVSLHRTFNCPGVMTVGGRPLRCWGEWAAKGHGSVDLPEILAKSCNLGAAQVVLRIGARRFTEFLKACGLGTRTLVGLPGEADGKVYPADSLRQRDLANMGFGQHVLVTPLQLAAAIGAVVNDGVYMQPQIVRRVLNPDGSAFRDIPPHARGTVCSPEVSRQMRQMMIGVVEKGTGRAARIPGVAVGGKTGTAQVFDPKTGTFPEDQKVVSFVLIAPADRVPDFCILVVAKNPKVGEHGADVAAPVAKDIALYLLRRHGTLPEAGR